MKSSLALRYLMTGLALILGITGILMSESKTHGVEWVKTGFTLLILLSTFAGARMRIDRETLFIRMGLAFCIPADYVLGRLVQSDTFFGMGLFALGYLLYFFSVRTGKGFTLVFFLFSAFSIVSLFLLGQQTLANYLALVPYLSIITLMASAGWNHFILERNQTNLGLALGFSYLFLSDVMIGNNIFGSFASFGHWPVMFTYIVGQILITLSLRRQSLET